MIRVFKHYIPTPFLVLCVIENLILVVSIYSAIYIRYFNVSYAPGAIAEYLPEALTFAGAILLTMFAVGLYRREHSQDLRAVFFRLIASFGLALIALSLVFYVFPDLKIWRSAFAVAVILALVGILAARFVFLKLCDRAAFKRRILVLGAGARAAHIERLETDGEAQSFTPIGFLATPDAETCVNPSRVLSGVNSLAAFARDHGVEEIVVAVEDRRAGLPVEALLECKLEGISVTDYPGFCERETGQVDLDSLQPSWLIFSDGFVTGPVRNVLKRGFDIVASLVLLVFTFPLIATAALAVRLESHGPIFYRQERIGLAGRPFMLLKFRSMKVDAEDDGVPRWAAAKDSRVTRVGAFIRKTRIDELPQIFNVLKGEMSFVGPRPERHYFVDQLSAQVPYYSERHRVKPGITGWAQLNYPYGASIDDAKAKLQYDLYYVKNYSAFLDLSILMQTIRVVLWPEGVR
ncbi:MAG: TIGR03013 family XrtA/PEP-CTERM system glycosyltransferase [Alphaproteobacteria bacterium]